ncbi:uncharacterized protein TRIVIDRAFT_230990 [Trichoderma virens Gv29-8]|uniref:Uncharacterized protein n=1 Tax=Hypocrea virens (strain Gv29-8 / FGSC 10586) TaxID=413071 RepID=G9MXA1_HYPVG|nr:uncharacterized protein TRIVIDRAFT_230990 [Trichoderma virens Gv29-8]EHK21033.1 hypothetical protein TRIVIDRAFT_230990 [Trichoderma virens Gv29-8]UKZ52273.1 hypothetical protein TrVGV298_006048 [Trichoderma virens]
MTIRQFSPILRYSRRFMLGSIGTGVCYGAFAANSTIRFDSRQKSPPTASQPAVKPSEPLLSPRIIRQISAGSVVGFGTGLLVSLFSRTLVFIGGVMAAFYHLASSYGLGLPSIVSSHKVLTDKIPFIKYGTGNGWFVASFSLTFILAAFVRL